MKKTSLGLKKPEGTDLVNIQDMNDNMDVIEKELKVRVKTTGDIKDTTVTFTQESTRANIATGEKMSAIMGKIKKFFADLTAPAFAQMITTKADLMATKATGYVPDAKAVADAVSEVNGKLQWKSIAISIPVDQWVWHDFSQYNDILITVEKSTHEYEFCMFSANQLIADQRTFMVGNNKIYAKNNSIALINTGDGIGMAILAR